MTPDKRFRLKYLDVEGKDSFKIDLKETNGLGLDSSDLGQGKRRTCLHAVSYLFFSYEELYHFLNCSPTYREICS